MDNLTLAPYGYVTFGINSRSRTLFPVGKGSFEYANSMYYDDSALDADVIRLANAIIRYQNEQLLKVSGSGGKQKLYPYIPAP